MPMQYCNNKTKTASTKPPRQVQNVSNVVKCDDDSSIWCVKNNSQRWSGRSENPGLGRTLHLKIRDQAISEWMKIRHWDENPGSGNFLEMKKRYWSMKIRFWEENPGSGNFSEMKIRYWDEKPASAAENPGLGSCGTLKVRDQAENPGPHRRKIRVWFGTPV